MNHPQITTSTGWKLELRPLPGTMLLGIIPYVMTYAEAFTSILTAVQDVAANVDGGEAKDPESPAALAAAGRAVILGVSALGSAMLRPEGRDGLQVLAKAFREGTYIVDDAGKLSAMTEAQLAGVFAGAGGDMALWLFASVKLNFASFLGMFANVAKVSDKGENPTPTA